MAAKKATQQGDGFDLIRPECMENANEINFRKRPYFKKTIQEERKRDIFLNIIICVILAGYFG